MQLAQEEADELARNENLDTANTHKVTASAFLISGLNLEEQQCV